MSGKIISVDRALRILQTTAEELHPVGVTELSHRLTIPKAAVHRILQTLEGRQFVVKHHETQLYSLGPEIMRISDRFQEGSTLVALSEPYLADLASATGETVNLGILNNAQVFVIHNIQGRLDSRITLHLGPVADLHCSSLGKSLLVDETHENLVALLGAEPFLALTPSTITTLKGLEQELARVRRQGYALDKEETEEGLTCIGAPIRDWNERVVAALSVSAPSSRFKGERFEKAKRRVVETAARISNHLRGSSLQS